MKRFFKSRNVGSSRGARYMRRRRRPTLRKRRSGGSKLRRSFIPRKRKVERVRVSAPATVVAQTYYSTKFSAPKRSLAKKYAKVSSNFYTITEGSTLTAGSGAQARGGNNLMTPAQMRSALTVIGEQPGNTNGSLSDTNRIFWKTAERYTTFTNSTNVTAFVDIYHFVARRDTNLGLISAWQNGLNDEAVQISTDYSTHIGIGPRMSQAVNDYYKCLKCYQIVLNPGQSHQHNTKLNVYKIVNNDVIASDMQSNGFLAGLSHIILYVVRGAPVTDSATQTLVNTGPVKIDVVSTFRVSLSYFTDNDMQFTEGTATGMATAGNTVMPVNTLGLQTWNATTGQLGYQVPIAVTGTTV